MIELLVVEAVVYLRTAKRAGLTLAGTIGQIYIVVGEALVEWANDELSRMPR